jgi:hypothetical protein
VLGLFGPKRIAVLDGTAVKVCVRNHAHVSSMTSY